jgi:hypothetical protein
MKYFGSGLVFFSELGMLAALGWWGFATFDGALGWVVGLGVPLAVATVWGAALSPKASRPLPRPLQLAVRFVLLLGGAAAFFAVGAPVPGVVQAAFAVVGTLLADVLVREPEV